MGIKRNALYKQHVLNSLNGTVEPVQSLLGYCITKYINKKADFLKIYNICKEP